MIDVRKIADEADMIINGYAFVRCREGYRVLNLNRCDRASVISYSGEILETSMDDIEIQIVRGYFEKNRKFMEAGSAKFFVKENGDTILQNRGILNEREINKIQGFIKQNYQEMYLKWSAYSQEGYYGNKE